MRAYHKEHQSLHVNCEEPRAYYIPYGDKESALTCERNNSSRFMLLNGEWNFKFYRSFEDVGQDFPNDSFYETISVPRCWQTYVDRNYDPPLYSNLRYPFPVDPPYVPAENPCGHYNRKFEIKKEAEKEYYINFEGVSSCFYLYVNGVFSAYSQVSHCASEINVTENLKDGENTIDVLVVKWCDGSYLEDQDMFRLSGIFRDVYILCREKNHVKDVFIRTDLPDDFSNAQITVETDGVPEYELYSPEGKLMKKGSGNIFEVENPLLWNSENPVLYTLLIIANGEYIPFKIGFKKYEIKGNIAYFNGKPVKLYGINRHDNHPVTGYYQTPAELEEDLFLLKRANVNTIRTSHYPNSPEFVCLCDKYGFMLVDEADIETHGMGFEYKDTWDWYRWSMLSTIDEWEESYVDRAKLLFERDKNHACVIMWSLGNESGCGKNHRAMRNYIKSRDKDAVVHYENSHLEFKAVPEGENFSDISDVESRMYAGLDYVEEYAANPHSKKPFFYCEYCSSYTTGDIHAHADVFRKYPAVTGGCFWEFADHAIDIGGGKFRYGGDFGDTPNDGTCCIDGIVFPDRSLKPGYFDLKKAYEPFEASFNDGKLTVVNRRFFTSLSDMYIDAVLYKDGTEIARKRLDGAEIAPQSAKTFETGFAVPEISCVYLNVSLHSKLPSPWAQAEYEYGCVQIDLSCENEEKHDFNFAAPLFEETEKNFIIKSDSAVYTVEKATGDIVSCKADEKELFAAPPQIEIWKAPAANELSFAQDCRSASMDCAIKYQKNITAEKTGNSVIIRSGISFGGASVLPVLNGVLCYEFYGDGTMKMSFDGETRKLLSDMNLNLPRFGFRFTLPGEYDKFKYFGKGPHESYADRHRACIYGLFASSADENFVPYIKPIENGSHYGTKYGVVKNCGGKGVRFESLEKDGMQFNVSRFLPSEIENCPHHDELTAGDRIYVYTDKKMSIRGDKGYFEEIEPERKIENGKINFAILFNPSL